MDADPGMYFSGIWGPEKFVEVYILPLPALLWLLIAAAVAVAAITVIIVIFDVLLLHQRLPGCKRRVYLYCLTFFVCDHAHVQGKQTFYHHY